MLLADLVEQRLNAGFAGNIAGNAEYVAANSLRGIAGTIPVGKDERSPVLRKPLRYRATNAPARAGDERNCAIQSR